MGGGEHSKDCLSLPSDPAHFLKVLIFLIVTGFCETSYMQRRDFAETEMLMLLTAPWLHLRVDSLTTEKQRLHSILISPCWCLWVPAVPVGVDICVALGHIDPWDKDKSNRGL